jgi:predicted anti-sigma-YlaC factor YlaD
LDEKALEGGRFFMTKHYSYEDWCQYVKNEMDGSVREDVETHLYSCDQCLDIYLQVLESEDSELLKIQNETQFTESLMASIADINQKNVSLGERKTSFYQSSAFHYLLAAAMTIFMMSTGVFQSITKVADTVQSPQTFQHSPSFSEGLINKTFTWMDSFELKNKEVQK